MPSFKQTQLNFAAHLRNPKTHAAPAGIEERRLKIYKDLFFNSISGLVAGTFPVLNSILNESEWDALIRTFFQTQHNKTPHFPEIPREFVNFIKNEPTNPKKPYIYELALYEWLELHLDKHLNDPIFDSKANRQKLVEETPVINQVSTLKAYYFPVHQISLSNQPTAPMDQPIYILLWRNRHQKVKFTLLNPFSAVLWEKLKNNEQHSGQDVLTQIAQESNSQNIDQFIEYGAETLLQWQQQDIINTTRSI